MTDRHGPRENSGSLRPLCDPRLLLHPMGLLGVDSVSGAWLSPLGKSSTGSPVGPRRTASGPKESKRTRACLSPSVKALDLSTNPRIYQQVELCKMSNQHFRRLKIADRVKQDAIQLRGLLHRKRLLAHVYYWLTNDWKLMLLGELRGTPGHAAGFCRRPPSVRAGLSPSTILICS